MIHCVAYGKSFLSIDRAQREIEDTDTHHDADRRPEKKSEESDGSVWYHDFFVTLASCFILTECSCNASWDLELTYRLVLFTICL